MKKNNRPIGVFDSGLGGLTIVRAVRRRLPGESIVYFGDIARLPYGIKSTEQIRRYSIENTEILLKHRVKAVIIACNSSSSAAYRLLAGRYSLPVIDVIRPAVAEAVARTSTGRIGVIATTATVASGVYERELRRRDPEVRVYQKACPLFVPIVEEGRLKGDVPDLIAGSYLGELRRTKVDTLVLGCTHYPLLKNVIRKHMGKSVTLIDSAEPTARELAARLKREGLESPRRAGGRLRLFVSDMPRDFARIGERFLRERMGRVRVVRL